MQNYTLQILFAITILYSVSPGSPQDVNLELETNSFDDIPNDTTSPPAIEKNVTKHTAQHEDNDFESLNYQNSSSVIEQTLFLLEEGKNETQLSTQYKEVILVLGNTGAGKSTMTHFLTGNNTELIAYEKDPVTILIKDNLNKISTSTITSKTIFPELIIDPETQTAFYDCPGFSDTRSTSVEIANAFFIKKVADHADKVKILLVVSHNSVKPGGDRKDLLLLLKHTTDFLKNLDNFQNSIALLVTKVTSSRSDARILLGIAQFLENARDQLDQVLTHDEILTHKKLLDILLQKDGQIYSKITFFRQPEDIGPLSEMDDIQLRKEHMKKVIYDNVFYTEKSESDFGYSLSEQAKNDIQKIVDTLNYKIQNHFQILGSSLEKYYQTILNPNKTETDNINQVIAEFTGLFESISVFPSHDFRPDEINKPYSSVAFISNFANQIRWAKNPISEKFSAANTRKLIEDGENFDFLQNLQSQSQPDPYPYSESFAQSKEREKKISMQLEWAAPISKFISNVQPLLMDFSESLLAREEKLAKSLIFKFDNYFDIKEQKIATIPIQNLKQELESDLSHLQFWENLNSDHNVTNSGMSEFIDLNLNKFSLLGSSVLEDEDELKSQLKTIAKFFDFIKEAQTLAGFKNDFPKTARTIHQMALESKFNLYKSFQSFASNSKKKLLNSVGILHMKIEASTARLVSSVESYYLDKLQLINVPKFSLTNLRENAVKFNTILKLHGIDIANPEISKLSKRPEFISDFARDFSRIILEFEDFESVQYKQNLDDIKIQCEVLSMLQKYQDQETQTKAENTFDSYNWNWLLPIITFVKQFNQIIEPPACNIQDIGGQLTLIVKGSFISLQEVKNSCLSHSEGIGNIIVVSLHTVLIDADLNGLEINPNSSLTLGIISPNWVMNTTDTEGIIINLNGANAPNHKFSQAGALHIYNADGEGLRGQPGLPGGNAGNFLGIGQKTENFNLQKEGKLRISTVGGTGGRGQDGGNGRPGFSSENVDLNKINYFTRYHGEYDAQITLTRVGPYNYVDDGLSCEQVRYERRSYVESNYLFGFIPVGTKTRWESIPVTMYNCKNYIFSDERATSGKRGGDGGAPGYGGRGGVTSLFFPPTLNTFEFFDTNNGNGRDGNLGVGGEGGKGGYGGKRGDRVKVRLHRWHINYDGFSSGKKIITWETRRNESNGANGFKGSNFLGRMQPAPIQYSKNVHKNQIIQVFQGCSHTSNGFSNVFLIDTLESFKEYLESL